MSQQPADHMLDLHLANDQTHYRPGQFISGDIRWALTESVESIELRLLWYTEGKGTRDVEIVDHLSVIAPAQTGKRPFTFPVPLGPYSFSGRLISIIWALELMALPDQRIVRCELIVSPGGEEVTPPTPPLKDEAPLSLEQ